MMNKENKYSFESKRFLYSISIYKYGRAGVTIRFGTTKQKIQPSGLRFIEQCFYDTKKRIFINILYFLSHFVYGQNLRYIIVKE